MSLTHLSLFSGIGGLDLAAEWAGFKTVGQCEWADFPTKILEKHWPDVPRWRDIHDLTGEDFRTRTGLRTVDVISGGFPCQPFSVAGKQKGKDDERYLFPEMLRIIADLKPRFVVGENVPGILRIAAADVVQMLEREGYECVLFDFEAAAVGAHHRRERIAFVAFNPDGEQRHDCTERIMAQSENANAAGVCKDVSDAESERNKRYAEQFATQQDFRPREGQPDAADSARNDGYAASPGLSYRPTREMGKPGEVAQPERPMRWPVEPDVGGSVDGLSDFLDRIGGLSNGAKARAFEILRDVREDDLSKAVQWTVGRFDGVSEAEVLLAILCEYEEASNRSGFEMEGGAATETIMRNLWRTIEASRSPHQRRYIKQYAGEYSDALFRLSHGAPSLIPQAWTNGSWEDGLQRVAHGVKNRVDRIKALGNAVVPAQFYPIFRAIAEELRGGA